MAASLLGLSAARAQDASEWNAETHTAARLIAGALAKTSNATFLRAGIEIKLDTGWKTYWRDPGDSGVPPTFDFSGSENVKAVTVLWPAPARFPDGAGGNSIGYLEHVVLPLRVAPLDATKRTSLKLKLGYDVCGNMCVPVDADLKLPLTGDGAEESAIEKAEVRVPRHLALGEGKERGLAVLAVHREPGGAHERVVVDVAAPAGAAIDLFVEGPTPEWSLPLPEPVAGSVGGNGSTRQFSFELDGLPPDASSKGAMLTFTAVSADDAIEVPAHLD
ncbi:MAG: protein-disulfide reductase DsbD domain-containing protein [Xanthobacteraceae bacterium]